MGAQRASPSVARAAAALTNGANTSFHPALVDARLNSAKHDCFSPWLDCYRAGSKIAARASGLRLDIGETVDSDFRHEMPDGAWHQGLLHKGEPALQFLCISLLDIDDSNGGER